MSEYEYEYVTPLMTAVQNNDFQIIFADMLLGFRYGLISSVIIFLLTLTFGEVLYNAMKSLLSR